MLTERPKLTVIESKFKFTVDHISKIKDSISSPQCVIQHLPWNIIVKPEYETQKERQPLGLSIICEGNNTKNWTCLADVQFSLYSSKKNRRPFSRLNNSLTEVRFRHTYKNILNMQEPLTLGPFIAYDLAWKILVKPPSIIVPVEPKGIGLFLQCNNEVYSDTWSCRARAVLGIRSRTEKNDDTISRTIEHTFCSKRNTAGWDSLVLWKDLLDAGKQYIKDDSIIVQAHVSPEEFNLCAYLSVREATFWFTVKNISTLNEIQSSLPCFIANMPWKIRIGPVKINGQKSLSFFLNCNETNNLIAWSCNADAELRILPCNDDQKPFTRKLFPRIYSVGHDSWGTKNFIMWDDLVNPEKGFIEDDSVIFEAYVKVID
ncbi:Similar to USP7: Ubiquitin carboxyl-terminal hydrolase 7 (Homo sapiens) [Cotesia congregata]|uniref:Similar to USP7: Ubiquitin carboxyl-terminal hydrolase 7 (Homo sapiens) n=1 Tax=Cotesia congregata TaxID=51543 RepID=A0A8J2HLV2_COTCN|nr:Similar to USP7: Ubiquitin carboxyl-terminal hydrolase 7 (Homo sapiens) [Cotesia congregata]